MQLFSKDLSPDSQDVVLISEIGVNHEGDPGAALRLLNLAADAGADAVKFQSYTPERFLSTGDAERLGSLLAHILDNARQAAGPEGSVRLKFHAHGARGTFEITDNGPGMDATFVRDQLFKPFRSTKKEGLGLGLYQCREYARELGGRLEVISSVGGGTTVRITLPGRPGDGRPAVARQAEQA